MNAQKQTKGFTIIEVVLVLAIAALIFLMIFIALPALQRGQRDTARKQDVGVVSSAITSYRTNNNNSMPTAGTYSSTNNQNSSFYKYLYNGNSTLSNNTTTVIVRGTNNGNGGTTDAQAEVWPGGKCGANGAVVAGTAGSFAVTTKIEAGGGSAFCQNS